MNDGSNTKPTSTPSAPRRILRRAGNILTSTGQPAVKDLDEILIRNKSMSHPTGWTSPNDGPRIGSAPLVDSPLSASAPTAPKLKLSASIKRKFREVRESAGALGRSKSMGVSVMGGVDGGGLETQKQLEIGNVVGIGNGLSPKRKPAGIHSRSFSLSSPVPPPLLHTTSSPARMSIDGLRSVPEVEAAVLAPTFADITVPLLLQQGTPMTKVSNNKRKKLVFRLDPELGQISWESKQRRISMYTSSFRVFPGLIHLQFQLKLSKNFDPPPTPGITASSSSSPPNTRTDGSPSSTSSMGCTRHSTSSPIPATSSGCGTTFSTACKMNLLVDGRSERRFGSGDAGVGACRLPETAFQPKA